MNIHKSQLWIDVNRRGTIGFDTLPYAIDDFDIKISV